MITIIVLVLILSVLILVHEFGHFFMARKIGVRVEEFGWGLPPRAWGKKIGETIYSINWLPFGGFVKLTGEDFEEEIEHPTNKDPRSFVRKTPLQRIAILISGILMNVLLAIFIYYIMFFISGYKTVSLPLFYDHSFKFGKQENINTVVMNYLEDSAALEEGIEIGEAIIEVDGVPVYSAADVRKQLEGKGNQEVSILLMDVRKVDRTFRTVHLIPRANEEEKVLIGVALAEGFRLSYSNKVMSAPRHAYNMFVYSTKTLANLAKDSYKSKDITPLSDSVSGPVGIFGVVRSIIEVSGKETVVGLLDLSALLSLSLVLLNILPFPALDGGRLLFVVYELVTKKKLNPKAEGVIHRWGIVVLLILLVSVTIKDFRNLFS